MRHAVLARLAALAAIVTALLLFATGPSRAETADAREYILKAAFVYNFGKFVEWPPAAFAGETAPLVVCVHGERAFEGMTTTLKAKTVGGRPILVIDGHGPTDDVACHIIFIGDHAGAHRDALSAASARYALTVGDSEDFIRAGGMVGLITIQNKIRFEVNLKASRRAGLRISATLLRLAKTVLD